MTQKLLVKNVNALIKDIDQCFILKSIMIIYIEIVLYIEIYHDNLTLS